jgi:uncharacterized protein YndB with AHSA1/START domain
VVLRIAVAVAAFIAVVLVFAATKPNTFRVQRSAVIDAPAERIFVLVNDFHNWYRWAPQDKEDSTMRRTYSGAQSGRNAVSEWQSNGSAGRGRMSIIESVLPTRISVETDFTKPFVAHNLNEFVLEPAGSGTRVTWTMQGTNLYLMKIMGTFVNMDRMMGKHFETGLNSLKIVAETEKTP